MDDKDIEYNNTYSIPVNYTDSGKLFGGMLEPRNTVETAILLILIGYPELMWMSLPFMLKIAVMTITLLPVCVAGLMGIGGDSLIQFAAHIVLFWLRRRKLHLRRIGYKYAHTKKTKRKRCGTRSAIRAKKGF